MDTIRSWRDRAADKRRKASIEAALSYLDAGIPPKDRRGNHEKRVRDAVRPMTVAKALVREHADRLRRPKPKHKHNSPYDRAACIRTAYNMELGHSWPGRGRRHGRDGS